MNVIVKSHLTKNQIYTQLTNNHSPRTHSLPNPPSSLIYSTHPKSPKEFHHANHLETKAMKTKRGDSVELSRFFVFGDV